MKTRFWAKDTFQMWRPAEPRGLPFIIGVPLEVIYRLVARDHFSTEPDEGRFNAAVEEFARATTADELVHLMAGDLLGAWPGGARMGDLELRCRGAVRLIHRLLVVVGRRAQNGSP